MKKILALATGLAFALAGCATTPTPTTATNAATTLTNTVLNTANTVAPLTSTKTQTLINNIINSTKLACGFVPTTLTVGALLSGNAGVSTASGIVDAICNAVTAASPTVSARRFATRRVGDTALGQQVVTSYKGILITGHFVSKHR